VTTEDPIGVPLDSDVTFRLVSILSVEFNLVESFPRVQFQELEGVRRTFSMPIGINEAKELTLALAARSGPRPSSSELTVTILTSVGADVIAVRLVRYDAGVFFAELDLMTARGRRVIDCRPSDALAIALRHPSGAPILIDEGLLQAIAEPGT
jgi:bifunctional DNase/RNase